MDSTEVIFAERRPAHAFFFALNGSRPTPLGLTRLGLICVALLCTPPPSRRFGSPRFDWLNLEDGRFTMLRQCWLGPIDTSVVIRERFGVLRDGDQALR